MGLDPYIGSGAATSLPADRRRVAHDTYWAIRRSSQSVRLYMSNYYPGEKNGQTFEDLWLAAELVDCELDRAYRIGGLAGVNGALASNDTLEHLLSRIGAQVALARTGDHGMYRSLLTSRPPGQSDILPEWSLTAARDVAKVQHLQQVRVKGSGPVHYDDDDVDGGAPRRARRRGNDKGAGKGDAAAPKGKAARAAVPKA